MGDAATIAWKEWKELFAEGGGRRGGWYRIAVFLLLVGVLMPLQMGTEWVTSPVVLGMAAWMPFIMISAVIADAFAGERERHTLETLLASRLSDQAILMGKVIAAVGYGWGVMLVAVTLALVVVNLRARGGGPLLYPPWMLEGILGLGLLTSLLAAGAGVLVSLRAATVRQAQQTLSIASMLLIFVPTFAIPALPATWRASAAARMSGLSAGEVIGWVALGLIVVDALLIAWARARFRRGRLIVG